MLSDEQRLNPLLRELEVMQARATQDTFRKTATLLHMEFAGAILEHPTILKAHGFCNQAEFSVHGLDEAFAKLKAQVAKLKLHQAAAEGRADEVQLVMAVYPERANSLQPNMPGGRGEQYRPISRPTPMTMVLTNTGFMPAPQTCCCVVKNSAARKPYFQMIKTLLGARADVNARGPRGYTSQVGNLDYHVAGFTPLGWAQHYNHGLYKTGTHSPTYGWRKGFPNERDHELEHLLINAGAVTNYVACKCKRTEASRKQGMCVCDEHQAQFPGSHPQWEVHYGK